MSYSNNKSTRLRFFGLFDLINPHTTVFSSSAVMGLFAYFRFPGSFTHAGSLTKKDFCLPQLIDDSLRRVASSHHLHPPFFDPYSKIITGPILGNRSG